MALQRLLERDGGLALNGKTVSLLAVTTASAFVAGCVAGWLTSRAYAQRPQHNGRDSLESIPAIRIAKGQSLQKFDSMPSSSRHFHVDATPSSTPRLSRAGSGDSLASMASFNGTARLKVLLVMRMDVELDGRKVSALSSRAVLQLYKKLRKQQDRSVQLWDRGGQLIVCLRADSQGCMEQLQDDAASRGVPSHGIKDRASSEMQVLALGPAESDLLYEFTNHLKLL